MHTQVFITTNLASITLQEVLKNRHSSHVSTMSLDIWIASKSLDSERKQSLYKLLKQSGILVFHNCCTPWFSRYGLGHNVQVEPESTEDQVCGSFVVLTELGQQFMETLYTNYTKPNL